IRSQTHDFPFIAIGCEAEKLRELAIEQSDGIRERNRKEMIQAAIMAMPDGGGFPSTAAIHHNNRGIRKATVGVRADGMRKMMINVSHARLHGTKLPSENLCSTLLTPHARKMPRRIQEVHPAGSHTAGREAFQIMTKGGAWFGPAKTYFVQV